MPSRTPSPRSSSNREGFLLDLIDRIYAAGLGEVGWDEVARPVRDALGCSVVAIHADDAQSGESLVVSNLGLDPDEVAKYETYYVTRNVWLHRAAPLVRTGTLFHGEELISQEALHRTEYYNDFARPNRLGRAFAVCLHHEPELIAFFSMFKPPGGGRFSTGEVEIIRLLQPHLQRAAAASRTFRRLRTERHLAARALDSLSRGTVVFDWRGRIVFMNRRMRRIVERADGVFVRDRTLRFSDPDSTRNLEAILARPALEASGGAFLVGRPSLRAAYEVTVTPLPKVECPPSILSTLEGRTGWLVLVADPEREPRRPLETLCRLYGLTEAEAEVANLLALGRTLREIGEIRGTTRNTVKTQTRLVYQKLDVSSRSELVRRLHGLGSAIPRNPS